LITSTFEKSKLFSLSGNILIENRMKDNLHSD